MKRFPGGKSIEQNYKNLEKLFSTRKPFSEVGQLPSERAANLRACRNPENLSASSRTRGLANCLV